LSPLHGVATWQSATFNTYFGLVVSISDHFHPAKQQFNIIIPALSPVYSESFVMMS